MLSFKNSGIVHPRTLQTVYIATPTGGVKMPVVTTVETIIPKNTGSNPKLFTIGRRIGVRRSMTTEPSMNIPNSRRAIMIIAITTNGCVVIPVIKAVIFCGTLSKGMPYPKIPDIEIMNMIAPTSTTASFKVSINLLKFSFL